MATSRNSGHGVERRSPAAGRLTDQMLQSDQTEKPRFSTKIEKTRLRQATAAPVAPRTSSSSGRQSLIQRPAAGRQAG